MNQRAAIGQLDFDSLRIISQFLGLKHFGTFCLVCSEWNHLIQHHSTTSFWIDQYLLFAKSCAERYESLAQDSHHLLQCAEQLGAGQVVSQRRYLRNRLVKRALALRQTILRGISLSHFSQQHLRSVIGYEWYTTSNILLRYLFSQPSVSKSAMPPYYDRILSCLIQKSTQPLNNYVNSTKNSSIDHVPIEPTLRYCLDRFITYVDSHPEHARRIMQSKYGMNMVRELKHHCDKNKGDEMKVLNQLYAYPFLTLPWDCFLNELPYTSKLQIYENLKRRQWNNLTYSEMQNVRKVLKDTLVFSVYLDMLADSRYENEQQQMKQLITNNVNLFRGNISLLTSYQDCITIDGCLDHYKEISDENVRHFVDGLIVSSMWKGKQFNTAVHSHMDHPNCCIELLCEIMKQRKDFDLEWNAPISNKRTRNVIKTLVLFSPTHTVVPSLTTLLECHQLITGRCFKWKTVFHDYSILDILKLLPKVQIAAYLDLLYTYTDCKWSPLQLLKLLDDERNYVHPDDIPHLCKLTLFKGKPLLDWARERSEDIHLYLDQVWDEKTQTSIEMLRNRLNTTLPFIRKFSNCFFFGALKMNRMDRHMTKDYLVQVVKEQMLREELNEDAVFEVVRILSEKMELPFSIHGNEKKGIYLDGDCLLLVAQFVNHVGDFASVCQEWNYVIENAPASFWMEQYRRFLWKRMDLYDSLTQHGLHLIESGIMCEKYSYKRFFVFMRSVLMNRCESLREKLKTSCRTWPLTRRTLVSCMGYEWFVTSRVLMSYLVRIRVKSEPPYMVKVASNLLHRNFTHGTDLIEPVLNYCVEKFVSYYDDHPEHAKRIMSLYGDDLLQFLKNRLYQVYSVDEITDLFQRNYKTY